MIQGQLLAWGSLPLTELPLLNACDSYKILRQEGGQIQQEYYPKGREVAWASGGAETQLGVLTPTQ